MRDYTAKGPKKVIQINEKELQQHLSTLVTDTVQEVLNIRVVRRLSLQLEMSSLASSRADDQVS